MSEEVNSKQVKESPSVYTKFVRSEAGSEHEQTTEACMNQQAIHTCKLQSWNTWLMHTWAGATGTVTSSVTYTVQAPIAAGKATGASRLSSRELSVEE